MGWEDVFEALVKGAALIAIAALVLISLAPLALGLAIVDLFSRIHYHFIGKKEQEKREALRREKEMREEELKQKLEAEKKEKAEESRYMFLAELEERRRKEEKRKEEFRAEQDAERKREARKFGLDKGFHLEKNLKKEQKERLLMGRFKRLKVSPYGVSGSAYYLVKTRYNEGPEHAFFCYLIEEELKQKGVTPTLNVNSGPDVVFTRKDKSYCFDVETGENLKKKPLYVKNKFAKYRKEHSVSFIFVTKKKLKYAYSKHGNVVTRSTLKTTIEQLFL